MTLDRLAVVCLGALAAFVAACAVTARILRDYLENWEGTTS